MTTPVTTPEMSKATTNIVAGVIFTLILVVIVTWVVVGVRRDSAELIRRCQAGECADPECSKSYSDEEQFTFAALSFWQRVDIESMNCVDQHRQLFNYRTFGIPN
jgi:hypothetical protein